MKIHSPSLIELHAFLAVCRQGSFRRAAEVLCVTQAAVSRAVQRLEAHLAGGRLFERQSSGVTLTSRGLQLRQLVERHVLALEAAAETMGRLAQPQRVRLSVIPTLGIQWLMPRLSSFTDDHPEVSMELRQFKHDEDFTRDDVDLWIEVKRPGRRWPAHVQARYLLGCELISVCTPRWHHEFRVPQDLQRASLLHHTNFPDNWARWFAGVGVPCMPLLGPGFDLTMQLIVAAKAGMGVAVVPACLVERELLQGELVMPFDRGVTCDRGYYVCWKRDTVAFSARDKFLDWLAQQAPAETGRGARPSPATHLL